MVSDSWGSLVNWWRGVFKMSGSCWYQQGTSDKSFPDSSHDFIKRSDQELRWEKNAH